MTAMPIRGMAAGARLGTGKALIRSPCQVHVVSFLVLLAVLALAGCASSRSVYPMALTVRGVQDCKLRCDGPQEPIVVVSRYCGITPDSPLSITNGSVVFFVLNGHLAMIGWDDEDNLGRGGQIQVADSVLHGATLHGRQWWNLLAAVDRRFAVVDIESGACSRLR